MSYGQESDGRMEAESSHPELVYLFLFLFFHLIPSYEGLLSSDQKYLELIWGGQRERVKCFLGAPVGTG